MPTSTTTPKGTALERALAACAVPIDDVAAVRTAGDEMARTAAAAEASTRRGERFEQILNPNLRAGDGARFEEAEVLEAYEGVAAARVEAARARRQALDARNTYAAVFAAERARRYALVREAKREVARRLLTKLRAVSAGENADAALLDEAERILRGGSVLVQLAWTELQPSTPTFQGRIDAWEAALRDDGLLD